MGSKRVYVDCDNCGSKLHFLPKLTKCKGCSQVAVGFGRQK
jgi:hypothetical protein